MAIDFNPESKTPAVSGELSGALYAEPRWIDSTEQPEIIDIEAPSFETSITSAAGVGIAAVDSLLNVDIENDQSFKDRAENLYHKMRNPVLTASLATAAVATWGFEAGPANEKLRADIAVSLYEHGHKAVVAGAVVGGITMGVELATGLLTAATINVKTGVLGKFNQFLFRNAEQMETTDKDGHKKSDAVLGLAGGSTPVIIERQRRNPKRIFKDNAKTAVAAAGGIAAFTGALTGVAIDLIDWASVNNFYEQANGMKETLEDARTWIGIFALLKTIEHAGKFKDSLSAPRINYEQLSLDLEWPENKADRRKKQLKRVAQVAGGVAFIGISGPSHLAEFVNNLEIMGVNPANEAGGYLADSQVVDKIEDYGSYLWDWRIWTAGFLSQMGATKIVQKFKSEGGDIAVPNLKVEVSA